MSGTAVADQALVREAASVWCLRLAEGPLDPEESAAFGEWLAVDPRHGELFDEAVSLWRTVEKVSADPEVLALRVAALESMQPGPSTRPARRFKRGGLVLASAGALLASAAGYWYANLPDVYQTGIGERRLVALPDGSKMSLDASSEVKVSYSRDRRDLMLENGRARFEVAKDPLRPFSVSVNGRIIVATGTQFSVERLNGEVRVILLEGKVAVLRRDADGERAQPVRLGRDSRHAEYVLAPGKELVIGTDRARAEVSTVDPDRSLAWESGQLVFADEPLAQAIQQVNRYATRPIVLADSATGNVRISGAFTAGDVAAFVEGVTSAFPIRAKEDADRIIFSGGSPAR